MPGRYGASGSDNPHRKDRELVIPDRESTEPPRLQGRGARHAQQRRRTVGVVRDEEGRFVIDPEARLLTVNDETRDRVLVGEVSAGTYGIEIYDSSGSLILSAASGLGSSTVGTSALADGSVTTVKIASVAVTTAKIANAAITNAKIGTAAVDTAEIANAAITNAKIGNLAVDTAKIQDAAIETAKINNLAVDTTKLATDAVTADKITAGTITANEIAGDTITASEIAGDTITTSELAANSVTATEINVSQLSAISADLGTVNAGSVNIGVALDGRDVGDVRGLAIDRRTGIHLDGTSNSYLYIENKSYSGTISDLSVEAWIRTTAARGIVVGFDRNEYFRFGVYSGEITFQYFDAGSGTARDLQQLTGVTINDGNWHHIAAVAASGAGEIRLYVDGQRVHTDTNYTGSIGTGSTRFGFIGDDSEAIVQNGARNAAPDTLFDGDLDEVRLWEGVIDDAGITDRLYRRLIPSDHSALTAYWPLQAGTGDRVFDLKGNFDAVFGSTSVEWVGQGMVGSDVGTLSAISADIGTITAGWLGDTSPGSASAAIRLSGTTTLPSTNFIDFTATGNSSWLEHSALTLQADGDADFGGTVSATSFTGDRAQFSGSIQTSNVLGDGQLVEGVKTAWLGGLDASANELVEAVLELSSNGLLFSTGGSVTVGNYDGGARPTNALELDDSGNVLVHNQLKGASGALQMGSDLDMGGRNFDLASAALNLINATTHASAGTSSGTYLEISVNGTAYKLDLLNT